MRRTTLIFTVSIPVTYDEAYYTEGQAKDAAQTAAKEAIARACDGRRIDLNGRHTDCAGPELVAGAGHNEGEG